jgi:predicted permease
VRQLLTESLLLSLLGGLAGLLLAFWLTQMLMALKPPLPESWGFNVDLRLDWPVLCFTLLLSLVVSLFFGLVPALQASKPDVIPGLKNETGAESGGTRHHWGRVNLRSALVVVQIAVSLVLLISAGLFTRSLRNTQMIDPGFQTESRLAVSFNLAKQGYNEAKEREFSDNLVERIGALPGVQSVTLANFLPLGFMSLAEPFTIEGGALPPGDQPAWAAAQIIGQDYFHTIGTQLVRGRDFTPQDTANSPAVAIINETMARRFWPNEDALGKRVRIGRVRDNPQPREVIGIVKDTAMRSLGEDPQAVTYRSLAQQRSSLLTLVVHTTGDPKALIASVRREVQSLDENLPTQEIKTLDEIVSFSLWPMRMGAGLVGGFSLLGLLLATVGIYSVMSYAVAQRTREIGVRMALGAQARDVLKLIVRQGLTLTLVGSGIGLALAFVMTRLLVNLLYGVGAADPATFAGVALLLIVISLVACYLPARRATHVDPLRALRHE